MGISCKVQPSVGPNMKHVPSPPFYFFKNLWSPQQTHRLCECAGKSPLYLQKFTVLKNPQILPSSSEPGSLIKLSHNGPNMSLLGECQHAYGTKCP